MRVCPQRALLTTKEGESELVLPLLIHPSEVLAIVELQPELTSWDKKTALEDEKFEIMHRYGDLAAIEDTEAKKHIRNLALKNIKLMHSKKGESFGYNFETFRTKMSKPKTVLSRDAQSRKSCSALLRGIEKSGSSTNFYDDILWNQSNPE